MDDVKFRMYDDKGFRRQVAIWIAEYAYYKANPETKMDVPSSVYEQVEKDFDKFLEKL